MLCVLLYVVSYMADVRPNVLIVFCSILSAVVIKTLILMLLLLLMETEEDSVQR